ncbi:MAG: CRISPR-associated endoribonuclease Cas6 [bacterium]|nr:CRISPR-associated endoribonuclease Cas6 [bacterium]
MQVIVQHKISGTLELPIHYHHILQAILFSGIRSNEEYSTFLHDEGFLRENRRFKMFTFSELSGKYEVVEKRIFFRDRVTFEVRSPDVRFIRILQDGFQKNGIAYGNHKIAEVRTILKDQTVEQEEAFIKMITPVCVYSTDPFTKKTFFYQPNDSSFGDQVEQNFMRKYEAYYGVKPESGISLQPVEVSYGDKCVTKYKNFYISGWKGIYRLSGERKYLDFLYQTGLGSKNSQGFGMFQLV